MINCNFVKRRLVNRIKGNILLRNMFRKKLKVISYTCLIVGAYVVYSEVYMTMMLLETVGRTGLVVKGSHAKHHAKNLSASLGSKSNNEVKNKEQVRKLLHEISDEMQTHFNFDAASLAFKLERYLRQEMKDTRLDNMNDQKQILIAATHKSRSGILGGLINSNPGVFYTAEPFAGFTQSVNNKVFLYSMLKCKFALPESMRNQSNPFVEDSFRLNFRMVNACKEVLGITDIEQCRSGVFLQESCPIFPYLLVRTKGVFWGERDMPTFEMMPNFKVLFLIRDPRGIYLDQRNSCQRGSQHSCRDTDSHAEFCRNYNKFVIDASIMQNKYKDRVSILLHEEMMEQPNGIAQKLKDFLGFPGSRGMDNYINNHRQSFNNTETWRSIMPFGDIWKIQQNCSEALDIMKRYQIFNSELELRGRQNKWKEQKKK